MTWRALFFVCVAIAGIYAAVCALFFVFQRRLIYFPGGAPTVTPDAIGLPYRAIDLETSDGQDLRAWLVGDPRATRVVLYCHGNAGSIGDRLDIDEELVQLGVAVFAFDYRGYGGSSGAPTEQGLYLDAEAAWEHLTAREGFQPSQVIAWGESLGGAVAIELARRRKIGALVVDSSFTSLADLGSELYPWLPVRWLARDRFDSIAKIPKIDVPILVLHSPGDEIVPFAHGERLARAAPAGTTFVRTSGGHNEGGFRLRASDGAAVAHFLGGLPSSDSKR